MSDHLAALAAAAQAAAPGPWSYGDVGSVAGGSLYDKDVMIASLLWDSDPWYDVNTVTTAVPSNNCPTGAPCLREQQYGHPCDRDERGDRTAACERSEPYEECRDPWCRFRHPHPRCSNCAGDLAVKGHYDERGDWLCTPSCGHGGGRHG